jgi:hypothetical protein
MEKALTICVYEWKVMLRDTRKLLMILGYPIVFALLFGLLARTDRGFIVALITSPFFLKGIKTKALLSNLPDVKPLVRQAAESVAMLPVFILQAALYVGAVALFTPAGVPTIGQIIFAVIAALIVALLVFFDR